MTGTWPNKRLAIYCDPSLPTDHFPTYMQALEDIMGVCDVSFAILGSPENANLIVLVNAIDGPGKDVALTQEPTPGITAATQLTQRFDSADLPGMSANEFYICCLHEIGHFLGREHSADGILSVMSAYLNTNLSGLTTYDVGELQAMYGPPAPVASTPAAPSPSAVFEFTAPHAGKYRLSLSLVDES